ncbi:MAG: hypothetical protein MHM6MM_006454 [Cercozoa sp. M6MM]
MMLLFGIVLPLLLMATSSHASGSTTNRKRTYWNAFGQTYPQRRPTRAVKVQIDLNASPFDTTRDIAALVTRTDTSATPVSVALQRDDPSTPTGLRLSFPFGFRTCVTKTLAARTGTAPNVVEFTTAEIRNCIYADGLHDPDKPTTIKIVVTETWPGTAAAVHVPASRRLPLPSQNLLTQMAQAVNSWLQPGVPGPSLRLQVIDLPLNRHLRAAFAKMNNLSDTAVDVVLRGDDSALATAWNRQSYQHYGLTTDTDALRVYLGDVLKTNFRFDDLEGRFTCHGRKQTRGRQVAEEVLRQIAANAATARVKVCFGRLLCGSYQPPVPLGPVPLKPLPFESESAVAAD